MTTDTIRMQIARRLLRWVLQLLPEWSRERRCWARIAGDLREYERYEALTLLMDEHPMPFEKWRREWAGMTRMRRIVPFPQRSATTARDRAVMGEAVAQ